ncbi:MAG: hypothetical protein RL681_727 [Candidatus Parcubacteria bacterium]|jgi:MFS family permease
MKILVNIDIHAGRVVKYFVFVDLVLLSGWGLIDPIFSIFIMNRVAGSTLVTVGIAVALYWLVKSVLQLPFANYLDRTPGEKDDFYVLIVGLCVTAFAAFSFVAVHEIWQLYAVQVVKAVGFALYGATWPAIFSRHLDKDRVSFDWTLDSIAVGLAAGASGFIGSVVANYFGFPAVFLFGGFLALVSALILIAVPDLMLPPRTTQPNTGRERQLPVNKPQ